MAKNDGGLRSTWQTRLPNVRWQSIESSGTSGGIPDMHYVVPSDYEGELGTAGWIENKGCEANAVAVRPDQVGWAERHIRAGGRTYFAVRQHCDAGPRRKAIDRLWLIHGQGGRFLMTDGLLGVPTQCMLGHWDGGAAQWDWHRILAILEDKRFLLR